MRVREIINISIEYVIKGIIMFAAIILVGMLLKNDVLRIIIQIVTAVIIYFALNYKYLLFEFLGMKKINKNGGIWELWVKELEAEEKRKEVNFS